jgi:ABC-type uncharacterized transport system involved in gliding motility auxiliary subunit
MNITQRQAVTRASILIAVVLLATVNIISQDLFKSSRIDLTENKLYTLSEGSKHILQEIDEPIVLRFFLSKNLVLDLPSISSYAIRVEELLESYARQSHGKIQLEVIDPEPFSEAEDQAVYYGLQGVSLDNSNTTLYFGLAGTNAVDDQEVVGFFQPKRESFLEYDLSQLIYRLAKPELKTIGLLSSLPLQGKFSPLSPSGSEDWVILEQMNQLFDVRSLELTVTSIPEDIAVLMLVHPKGLSDQTLYAIDQFVLRGGKLLLFMDPYSEAEELALQAPMMDMSSKHSDLSKLLAAWGVIFDASQVVGDKTLAKSVRAEVDRKVVVISYPIWMEFSEKQLDTGNIITSQLDSLTLATPGAISQTSASSLSMMPLIRSSKEATLLEAEQLGNMTNPASLMQDYDAKDTAFILAARFFGSTKSAFPEGRPTSDDHSPEVSAESSVETADAEIHLNATTQAQIIVVGDSDVLQDKFWVQVQNFLGSRIAIPFSSNGNFVINALDNLSGSDDLISLRSRGSFNRPFTRIEAIQREAEQRYQEKELILKQQLTQTEERIRELQQQKSQSDALVLDQAQQDEVARFRTEKVYIRKQLRQVQHELQKDISSLESGLKFINVGLMPLLTLLVGLFLYRRRYQRPSLSQREG